LHSAEEAYGVLGQGRWFVHLGDGNRYSHCTHVIVQSRVTEHELSVSLR